MEYQKVEPCLFLFRKMMKNIIVLMLLIVCFSCSEKKQSTVIDLLCDNDSKYWLLAKTSWNIDDSSYCISPEYVSFNQLLFLRIERSGKIDRYYQKDLMGDLFLDKTYAEGANRWTLINDSTINMSWGSDYTIEQLDKETMVLSSFNAKNKRRYYEIYIKAPDEIMSK